MSLNFRCFFLLLLLFTFIPLSSFPYSQHKFSDGTEMAMRDFHPFISFGTHHQQKCSSAEHRFSHQKKKIMRGKALSFESFKQLVAHKVGKFIAALDRGKICSRSYYTPYRTTGGISILGHHLKQQSNLFIFQP